MGVDDYRMGEKLGKGAFSTVYKVERKANSTSYACKRIDISKMAKNEISDAVNEIRILSSIRHPYIVGFFDSFLAKSDRELWIVMEMCSCGDLAAKVERYRKKRKYMDERVVWTHLIQMAEGLLCLHEANIVHRDLKAANIFLDENGSVKIGDLNVSKRMKGGHLLKTQIGTPYYMSPEVWLSKPYGMSSDIWALGCLVYELCALRPPFVGNTFPQLKQAVLCGKYPALPRAFSYEMTAIIARMVRINARERPSTRQLLDCTEVKERRAADWYKEPVAYKHAPPQSKQDLMDTIVVPHHLSQLEAALPKACFPDFRPNSPEAWPLGPERDAAMERKANGAQGAPANPRPVRTAGVEKCV
ncbi:kinase-like domain-containing protein [Pelagophyceae sp. CCMP2097]|nr:kinase-like domain-containing protein [Pelagophyceae sp. CCMP2097]